LPLGHGTVLSNPDKPYHVWSYVNGLGERITRNNPDDFLDAAEHMVRAMQCFREGDADFNAPGIPSADSNLIQRMLRETIDPDAEQRHRAWLDHVRQGTFSFGAEEVSYVGEGAGSWKADALGMGDSSKRFAYNSQFLQANWKLFHDALQAHRFDVLHHILPEYGICAA
jgi:hypothetical protein